MTPAARVQAAIEVLDAWLGGEGVPERLLSQWGRAHRFAGSGDRRAIADIVYDAVRRARSAAWVAGEREPASGRAVVRGSLMLDGADIEALFSGQRHGPPPLADPERGEQSLEDAPRPVRLDHPDWLSDRLADTDDRVLEAMRHRAPLDLRVNLLKARPGEAVAALEADGIAAEPGPLSPTALRVVSGRHRVAASAAYQRGLVEVQDAASQAVADFTGARPGETVLDLCAGGGGKTLALAAAMGGGGRLVAHDIAPERIAAVPERAARAGAEVQILETGRLAALHGVCDLVLIDVPCSGSGTWRRDPERKWRMTAADLAALTQTQDALLDRATRFLRSGGRLVYATCSILPCENRARLDAFLRRSRGWSLRRELSLTPLDGGDGFYAGVLMRRLISA